MSDSSTTHY